MRSLILLLSSAHALRHASSPPPWRVYGVSLRMTSNGEPYAVADDAVTDGETAEVQTQAQAANKPRFELEVDRSGAGFNQFDPVLSLTGFLSRRFGIFGGIGLVGLLAATEGREILNAVLDKGPVAASGAMMTTPSGLQYQDILVSTKGDSPLPGAVIGFKAVVSIGDKVLFDTRAEKAIAFKFGQRPFQSVVCEGLEEGLKGMKPGGQRKLLIPASLAPKGVELPPGVPLVYEVELTEVLPGYF